LLIQLNLIVSFLVNICSLARRVEGCAPLAEIDLPVKFAFRVGTASRGRPAWAQIGRKRRKP